MCRVYAIKAIKVYCKMFKSFIQTGRHTKCVVDRKT